MVALTSTHSASRGVVSAPTTQERVDRAFTPKIFSKSNDVLVNYKTNSVSFITCSRLFSDRVGTDQNMLGLKMT